jgi:hypothetical protein
MCWTRFYCLLGKNCGRGVDKANRIPITKSQPRTSVSAEDLQVDEAIDIKLLDSLMNDFIWYLAREHVSDEVLKQLIGVICRGCQLYVLPLDKQSGNVSLESRLTSRRFKDIWSNPQQSYTLGSDVLPVRRIAFAMHCIKALFSLCTKEAKGNHLPLHSILK